MQGTVQFAGYRTIVEYSSAGYSRVCNVQQIVQATVEFAGYSRVFRLQ